MAGKNFVMMFDVVEGGIVEPIEFDKGNLVPDKSIIVMDESNKIVWLWHGSRRGLVSRRTALRQAQSIKGHGYQAGNAIVGRDLNQIVEIDDRKVGREPETTELFKRFEPVINGVYENIGSMVYIVSDSPAAVKPKPVPVPETKATPETAPAPAPAPKTIQTEQRPVLTPVPVPEPIPLTMGLSEALIQGAVIMAVSTQFKDLWISQKPDNTIAVEHMDGKICTFKIEGGQVKYLQGSFAEVPKEKQEAIEAKFNEYLE
ncbi:MAG: hypothetical protein E4G98_07185 [Promethearchaeota archaeon]|nr:MAG: hypothetical protein E4G98_07185 [Candidatus Lokiarchaeota archaeon]